jgi:hypothetical protein
MAQKAQTVKNQERIVRFLTDFNHRHPKEYEENETEKGYEKT